MECPIYGKVSNMEETLLGKLLVVEDDTDLRELIAIAGTRKGYSVETAENGLAAKKIFNGGFVPSAVVLDINMPGMDGYGFCRWLREEYPIIPVVFLSARSDEYDKILALEIGGDDYLTKPFSMKELYARIRVCMRRIALYGADRAETTERPGVSHGGLSLRPDEWTCDYEGNGITLTVSEFRILHAFLINPGTVVSRDKLARAAFPEDNYVSGRSIDVHVCRLRQKLKNAGALSCSIESVYQVGYRWKI